MKWLIILFMALTLSIWGMSHSFAEDSHKHGHDEKTEHSEEEGSHKHEEGEEHKSDDKKAGHAKDEEEHGHEDGEEKGHDENEKHAHGEGEEEEEESSSVGPDKGILAKSDKGFQLAPEAIASFGLKTVEVSGRSLKIAKDSIVKIKDEKTIFRLRDGWYKRVAFKSLNSEQDQVALESSDLKSGDKVVVAGVGFLRMAEVAAEGGAAHGHSH